MGLLGALFRRKKRAGSDEGSVFALATAHVTLETRHGLVPTGKAGVCFRAMDTSFFRELEQEVASLMAAGERTAGTRYKVVDDRYGFRWVVLQDADFEDLVTAVYLVAQSFSEHGFRDQLLAADFAFREEGQEIHWIYSYKRNRFYPFVPVPGTQRRDNARELSLSAKVDGELPVEEQLERWYALWGAPFDEL